MAEASSLLGACFSWYLEYAFFAEYAVKFLSDLFGFLFSKKSRLVLIPFLAVILLFAALFVVLANSSWAPFVYAVF